MYKKQQKQPRTPLRFIEGTIRITVKGMGFVNIEEPEERFFIAQSDLGTALNRDEVRIAIVKEIEGDKSAEGEVIEILERFKSTFVGTVKKTEKACFVKPQDPKIHTDFYIPPHEAKKVETNQKVLIKMTAWDNPEQRPQASILSVIGWAGDNDTEMKSIVLDKGLTIDFPPEVTKEAQEIVKTFPTRIKDAEKVRRDMRDATTFTIDPADAKDFDDALSFETLENGDVRVGVHIADVSSFVVPGSLLDKEAQKRATSIYLVDRTIPMLPHELSDNICSLMPNEDRLTFSAVITFSKESVEKNTNIMIKDVWFGETLIHSNMRFSYEDAQAVLDEKAGEYFDELNTLNILAYKLREDKFKHGAIVLEQDEVKFVLDELGKPMGVIRRERGDTHKLIEDFMLLANKKAAEYAFHEAKKRDSGFIYRVHPAPEMERLENLAELMKSAGHNLPLTQDGVSSKDINKILKEIEGTPEENFLQTATVRSMSKALYSTQNIGHYGLAFEYYTHFTSPIRRYPDVMVHRMIKYYLEGKGVPKDIMNEYTDLALHSSDMEKFASEAERDSIKYKYVEYMADRIGKTYQGVISGTTAWGIYVQEQETLAEGMIRLADLGDDYYEYDREKQVVVGKKTNKRYRLGDVVTIMVKNVDLEKKSIDYTLVE